MLSNVFGPVFVRRILAASVLCVLPASHANAQSPRVADSVYRFIRDSLEHLFPLPKARDTAFVGTFDASGPGDFRMTSHVVWRKASDVDVPLPHSWVLAALHARMRNARHQAENSADVLPDDPLYQEVPELPINALEVSLLFKIQNAVGGRVVQATINDSTILVPATQDHFVVNVGPALGVTFTLRALPDSSSPRRCGLPPPPTGFLLINHHPYPIAGVYTLQAVPISILFAPPQYGMDSLNKAAKAEGVRVSSSFTMWTSNGTTTSSQGPAPTRYDDLMTYKKDLNVISQAFGAFLTLAVGAGDIAAASTGATVSAEDATAVKDAKNVVGGLSSLSSWIDKAIGSATGTQTDTSVLATGNSITVKDVQHSNTTWTTPDKATPGVGDRISYLHNVKFAYIAYYPCVGCEVMLRLTPLSRGTPDQTTPVLLSDDLDRINQGNAPLSGFSKATIQFLLSFDPFVGRNDMVALDELDSARFVPEETYPVLWGGTDLDKSYTHEESHQESQARKSSTTIAQDLRPGFLCFLGVGVTTDMCDNQITTVEVSTMSGAQRQGSVANTVTWKLHLETSDQDMKYYVTGYYDRLLRTYAFSRDTGEAVQGIVQNSTGQTSANQLVMMSSGGHVLKTRTDSKGRYSFGGHAIRPGQTWRLTVAGGTPVPVIIGRQVLTQQLRRP